MKLRVANLLSAVLVLFSLFPVMVHAQTGTPNFKFTADSTNVPYNTSATLHWSGQNITWCWGYRWATLPVDPDGSGWVQPPDQNTTGNIPTQTFTTPALTSDKSYSLICGQPNTPAELQTINITVGSGLAIKDFTPDHGSAGTNVIITGQEFVNVKSVKFNGRSADRYTVDGTTQITAVVDSGTTTGLISVQTPNQTVSSAQPFTITPPPKLLSFTASQTTINAGQTVKLSWSTNNQVTWCWGTGGDWGGGTWVQPPDQNTPPNTAVTGSQDIAPTVTTTYTLQCGAPGNSTDPAKTVKVTVNNVTPPPAPTGGLPYIKINGGDIFAGGWFNSESQSCDSQDPAYQSPLASGPRNADGGYEPNPYAGSIATYGAAPTQGSSTTQSAWSLGGIISDANSRYGFMTNGANQLTFANGGNSFGFTSPFWGGLLEGSTAQTHCIPDYYGTKIDLPKSWNGKLDVASGQYRVDGTGETPVKIPGGTIKTTQNVSLFVNGNAYISADITYDMNRETIDNIPKFALVVSGNIYISANVKQLDGLYIAQQNQGLLNDNCDAVDGTCHGRIYTCHDESDAPTPSRDFLSTKCRKQLTINGALVAVDVEFDRTLGDFTGLFADNKPAETINFIPEMVLGGSFFHGPSSASSNQAKIDSIISLPPIF